MSSEQLLRVLILQVSSATSTFVTTFSSSTSVIQYYLLHCFPVPFGTYSAFQHKSSVISTAKLVESFCLLTETKVHVSAAAYFVFLSIIAAFTDQHMIRRLIILLGRASLIIFILALTIFVSAISLGKDSLDSDALKSQSFWMSNILLWVATGGVVVAHMVEKLERRQHMGFENLCYCS